MDYSLLVGIHDGDREDKYMADETEEALDGTNNDQDNSSPAEDENGTLIILFV